LKRHHEQGHDQMPPPTFHTGITLSLWRRFHELNNLEYDIKNENEGMQEGRYEDEEPVAIPTVIEFVGNQAGEYQRQ